jgi:hypothetical protein
MPGDAGFQEIAVSTWTPLPTIREQLKRFYIGGAPMLRDPKQAGIPADFQGIFLNKYGLRTQSAGYVDLRINTVVQDGVRGQNQSIQPEVTE